MRINKYIAQAGVASRRKADELIANGNVRINGAVLKEPGYDVADGDVVEVNGRRVQAEEKKVYLLLNKPVGYVTTVSDDRDRATVMDLVADVDARIFPVGRLDYNTSGLLIMTNDGDFAYRLTHPKHEMPKTYRARVSGVLSKEKCVRLENGRGYWRLCHIKGEGVGDQRPAKVYDRGRHHPRGEKPAGAEDVQSCWQSCSGADPGGHRKRPSGPPGRGPLPETDPGRDRVPERVRQMYMMDRKGARGAPFFL